MMHILEKAGVAHRDVKDTNLHMGSDGLLRLLDFGLAVAHGRAIAPGIGSMMNLAPEALTPKNACGGIYSAAHDW
jgi:serine/threonine protein kinase